MSVDLPTVNTQGWITTDYSAVYCLTEDEILMHYEFGLIVLKVEKQEFSPSWGEHFNLPTIALWQIMTDEAKKVTSLALHW